MLPSAATGTIPIRSNDLNSYGESPVDQRVAKVREALETPNALKPGQSNGQAEAGMMWWRNAWGNGGGWHNWHNGWHNGGWGNWHNF